MPEKKRTSSARTEGTGSVQVPHRATLSAQVADLIAQSILDGVYAAGNPIPTEPELSRMYGVSRAVVRDAARILLARGLVDIRHGRGMFVTEAENGAFGNALALALTRAGASVWDVEEVEQILLPEVVALAAENATEEQRRELERLGAEYLRAFARSIQGEAAQAESAAATGEDGAAEGDDADEDGGAETLLEPYRAFMRVLYQATGNRLIAILAPPLLRLRGIHRWEGGEDEPTPDEAVRLEALFYERIIGAVRTRNAGKARRRMGGESSYPPEAIETMRKTPFGEIPVIGVSLRAILRNGGKDLP